MCRLMSKNGSSVSLIVDVNWSAGWKFETKSMKASSSSLLHDAAPTMSSMYPLCSCGVKPVYCLRIYCST